MSIFSSKKKTTTIKTLVASGTTIYGDIVFSDGLRIDGEVRGNIRAKSEHSNLLVISESAYIEGEIRATHIIVGGHVKGPICSSDLLELQPRARIEGDVEYIALEVHQGASVIGQLKPQQQKKAAPSSSTTAPIQSAPTKPVLTKAASAKAEKSPNVAYPESIPALASNEKKNALKF